MRSSHVAAAGLVAFVGCARPSAPPPASQPLTIVGVLIEQFSGRPLAGTKLKLLDDSPQGVTATTTAEGAFSFEGVQRDRYGELRGKLQRYEERDPGLWQFWPLQVLGGDVPAGEFKVYTTMDPPPGMKVPAFRAGAESGARVDLGRILAFERKAASEALGPVCESGQAKGAVLATGLAVLQKRTGARPEAMKTATSWNEWAYDAYLHRQLARSWKPPFPAFVCIRASYVGAGVFYTTGGVGLDTRWRVTVIDAGTGTQTTEAFTQPPPGMIPADVKVGREDPVVALSSWLAGRFR